ncbi:hypothetical protein ACHAWF_008992 [Thalassiosira exigua]
MYTTRGTSLLRTGREPASLGPPAPATSFASQGGLIEPPCAKQCNGDGNGGIGSCTISKKNQVTQRREPVFRCVGKRRAQITEEEHAFGEVIAPFKEEPEAATMVFNMHCVEPPTRFMRQGRDPRTRVIQSNWCCHY